MLRMTTGVHTVARRVCTFPGKSCRCGGGGSDTLSSLLHGHRHMRDPLRHRLRGRRLLGFRLVQENAVVTSQNDNAMECKVDFVIGEDYLRCVVAKF